MSIKKPIGTNLPKDQASAEEEQLLKEMGTAETDNNGCPIKAETDPITQMRTFLLADLFRVAQIYGDDDNSQNTNSKVSPGQG